MALDMTTGRMVRGDRSFERATHEELAREVAWVRGLRIS